MANYPRPLYDPELIEHPLEVLPVIRTDSDFDLWRAQPAVTAATMADQFKAHDLLHEDVVIRAGDYEITLAVLRPRIQDVAAPAIFAIHGGGMVFGNRFGSFMPEVLHWASTKGLTVISPEYSLAPENPAPRAARECHEALHWVIENASQLDIDPERIVLNGCSGGGGIAAAVALLAKQAGGPAVTGQLLVCPQLEHRHENSSSRQFSAANGVIDPWPTETSQYAWSAILGEGHERRNVDSISAPSRAEDLSGLPQTYIDVGGNEVFRDSVVDFGLRLSQAGVRTDLHVWAGGFHGFDVFVPHARLSDAAHEARRNWLERTLNL